jgi:hypothetical protein
MAIKKIYYELKRTSANTDYLTLTPQDKLYVLEQLMKIMSYVNEVQLIKHKDAKDVLAWFTRKTKTLPYNSQFKTHNSPMSFVAGLMNNLMFGTQNNISLVQSEHLENIISTFVTLVDAMENDLQIKLQKNTTYDTVLFVENFFTPQV